MSQGAKEGGKTERGMGLCHSIQEWDEPCTSPTPSPSFPHLPVMPSISQMIQTAACHWDLKCTFPAKWVIVKAEPSLANTDTTRSLTTRKLTDFSSWFYLDPLDSASLEVWFPSSFKTWSLSLKKPKASHISHSDRMIDMVRREPERKKQTGGSN